VKTDANGLATFTGLVMPVTPGQYELDFAATGYAEHAGTVNVTAAP